MNKPFELLLLSLVFTLIFLPTLNLLIPSDQLVKVYDNNNSGREDRTESHLTTVQNLPSLNNEKKILGAYIPDTVHLEDMDGIDQIQAISEFLEQGFNEYYFVMDNFWDDEQIEPTERLLDAADSTHLKIIIIILPPSEGGPMSSYNWKGWVDYFNDLKTRHPSSFSGFAIDDFNWISTRNDTQFHRNIEFMLSTNLTNALMSKRSDVKFYPVVYFEGLGNQVVVDEYGKYIDTLVLVSASYYNVSRLEANLLHFKEMFPGKPTRYIVYPTITFNYTRQGYDPPSDRLVMATLSIATRSVDGIILWHKIDGHVVQDYLHNIENPNYLHAIYVMETLQIADEKRQLVQQIERKMVKPLFSKFRL
jgi:hypothetical protein